MSVKKPTGQKDEDLSRVGEVWKEKGCLRRRGKSLTAETTKERTARARPEKKRGWLVI